MYVKNKYNVNVISDLSYSENNYMDALALELTSSNGYVKDNFMLPVFMDHLHEIFMNLSTRYI